jgi:hypothetical protein
MTLSGALSSAAPLYDDSSSFALLEDTSTHQMRAVVLGRL